MACKGSRYQIAPNLIPEPMPKRSLGEPCAGPIFPLSHALLTPGALLAACRASPEVQARLARAAHPHPFPPKGDETVPCGAAYSGYRLAPLQQLNE
jgi:hypothetical protein